MKVAEDSVAHVRSVYDKVKAQVDSAPRDDGTLLEKRKELQREVDVTKRTLAQQVPKNMKHKFLGSNLVFLTVAILEQWTLNIFSDKRMRADPFDKSI